MIKINTYIIIQTSVSEWLTVDTSNVKAKPTFLPSRREAIEHVNNQIINNI